MTNDQRMSNEMTNDENGVANEKGICESVIEFLRELCALGVFVFNLRPKA
jgi:hypothetical protein